MAGAVYYSLQSQKVVVNWDSKSQQVALGEVNWNWQTSQGEGYQEVDFWIRCSDSSGDVLEIHKIYRLAKGSRDVELSIRLKKLTDQQSCQVVLTQLGPLGLRRESSRVDQRMVFAGYRAADAEVLSIYQTTRKDVLKAGKSHTLGAVDQQAVWLGSTNQYFAALLAVVGGADQPGGKSVIAKTSAVSFTLDKELGDDFMVHWVTVPVKLSEGLEAQMNFEMYLGPKSVEIFEAQDRYGQLNYQGTIQYPWCTMQWLAELMGKLLKLLFKVTHNYGLAIILMVIIVRVLLHPVSKSSQTTLMKAQQDMQKLQPKMQVLKKKYSDNREALNKATMELYKQEGINPAGQVMGCLPMMLQMPIWFALYTTLYTTFELRHQPFFGWIRDLAGPDALIHFSQPFTIPLVSAMLGPIEYFNVLPILLGVSMLLMQKFMPKPTPPPGSGSDQAKQQKIMMYFMSGFIALVLYNAPSGLNLYILTIMPR